MCHKIKVKFKEDYKSFNHETEYIFEGNLNIISGINGAGKSQLLESIKSYVTEVYIDDIIVSKNDIVKYSFRDNISLPSFGTYDYNMTKQYNSVITNIFDVYKQRYGQYEETKKQNPNYFEKNLGISKGTTIDDYCLNNLQVSISIKDQGNSRIGKMVSKTTIIEIIDLIKQKHPEDFLELSSEEIINSIPSNFVFRLQDETVDGIVRVFTEAARLRLLEKAECGDKGKKFDNDVWLESAPWTEINNLFAKLNFNYRFLKDYDYEIPNLKEEPQLFAYENGSINIRKSRSINDLSDGEKAILNIVIATYDRKNDRTTRILLLDEYDATLNPSLIKDYYLVIQEYYLKRGITVLLSTHSPITISLAPENSKYYEIFRQNNSSPIIREINSEEYAELKILEVYYNKIKDPTLRLKELEGENESLKSKIDVATMPIVITEGQTDWKHIKLAKQKLENNDSYEFYEFKEDMGDSTLLNMLKDQSKIHNSNKRIFIFDNDNESIVKEVTSEESNFKKWDNNVYSFVIPKPNLRDNEEKISIEHYYTDEILKKEVQLDDGITRRLYCGNDFNKTGLNVDINKRCNNRKNCGSNIIRVLSGEGNEKVFDLDNDDENSTNYALTKEDFFDKIVSNNSNAIDFSSFNLILNIIKEIIDLDIYS